MHQPYKEKFDRNFDFTVRCKIYSKSLADKGMVMLQGARLDFMYKEDQSQAYMIWPEFLDENGAVITDTELAVPDEGIATMWILMRESLDFHKSKIIVGTRGFFVRGKEKFGELEVLKGIEQA